MDIIQLLSTAACLLTALGGFELVKWLFNRKSDKRVAEASATGAELKNDVDEFRFLRERLEYVDKQLLEKEQRFAEQTDIVRQLNKQLLDQTVNNGALQAEISELKAERKMKLCIVRNCPNREPQSGY